MIMILFAWLAQHGIAQQETLVWSDEFNGTGAPDPVKWGYDLGNNGWGNNEVQNYTNLTQNARQENGSLIITALKVNNVWTSARLLTNNKYEFKYGRVVFRAKLPVGIGTWPALWMLGENLSSKGWPACGEIDVMEHVGKNPGWVHSSVHSPSSYGGTVNTDIKFVNTFNTEFHTYQLNWTYEKLEFRIDSVLFYTYKPSVRNASTWPFDKAFFIIMNIAMGGNWGSAPQYETGGLKNGIEPSLYQATMEVDYVRVYQYPAGVGDPRGSNEGDALQPIVTPNPSNGKILVSLPAGYPVQGGVYNLMGINVCPFTSNKSTLDLDLSTLPRGLYLLSINSRGKTNTQKIVLN
jgi:beta-glucanase (GH16 family)